MKKIKYIDSNGVERCYARQYVINKTKEAMEEEGWKKFGEINSLYDEETDETILVQVLKM